MARPYSLYKKSSGIYAVQFSLQNGSRSNVKSTGCRDRKEAEKTVMNWLVNGNIPSRINGKEETKATLTVDKMSFFTMFHSFDFTSDDVAEMLKIMKERNMIISAVVPDTPEAKPVKEFLCDFWNMEKSPYVAEKKLRGQQIHLNYCETMRSRITIYWLPRLKDRTVGSITVDDVKDIFNDPVVKTLAHKTINSIISALTIPMKWAYYNRLTRNNCFDGIIKCSQKGKKRKILTMEQAAAVFKIDWENDTAKLANAVAMCTGMRQGEIAALRIEDIGVDRIYVNHSWSKYEGLKCCKTGDGREVAITKEMRDALLSQASLNPYGEGMQGFVFFGLKPSQPTDPKNWLKFLHRALSGIGYSNPKEICFHAWRHLWCSRMMDIIGDKRVVMAGSGHKTETMLDHYAEHLEADTTMNRLRNAEAELFLPVFNELDGGGITVQAVEHLKNARIE